MQYLKIHFLFPSAVFRCLSNDIALKGLFLHHCVVFSLVCVAIVISEPFFVRAYFRPDFNCCYQTEKNWRLDIFDLIKAKLKQKKCIFEWYIFDNLYLGDKNWPILFVSRKSSVVPYAHGLFKLLFSPGLNTGRW